MRETATKLTTRQRECLERLRDFLFTHGVPPTVRELATGLNIKSSSTHDLLKALEKKGYVLRRLGRGARSWTVEEHVNRREASKTHPRSTMQSPFRPQELLTADQFIDHCRRRGIQTSLSQLEYYDREDLLIPAVAVSPGVQERGRGVYGYGGLHCGTPGWLDHYEAQGLIQYPAQRSLREWSKSRLKWRPARSRRALENRYEFFYSKDQVFPLRHIQRSLIIEICDRMLFADGAAWARVGERVRTGFAGSLDQIQAQVLRYYETFKLLVKVRSLRDELWNKANQEYELSYREARRHKDAKKEALLCLGEEEAGCLGKAQGIVRESGLSIPEIVIRRNEFVYLGHSVDPTARWFDYLDLIPGEVRDKSEGILRFVLDCYQIANGLGWILERLGKRQPTLQEMLGGAEYRMCPYCQEYFEVKNVRQKTCGSPKCVRENRNMLKWHWRQHGGMG